jgi:voltage-gated potassium channel Kch
VWALFFFLIGGLPDLESAAYFSLTTDTTLGYGDVVLPAPRRLLGSLEAVVGVLMLGWSTAILVAAMGRVYRQALPALRAYAASPGGPP